MRGSIQLLRGSDTITNLQVDFLFPGILDANSLADADMRFSAVVENVITEALNRKVRSMCEKLLAENKGYVSDEDADFDEFPPMHRPANLPPAAPDIEDSPNNPAVE